MENRTKKGFYCSKGWRVFSRGWAEALWTAFWIRTCYMLHVTGSFTSGSQEDSVTNCVWFLYSGQVAQSAHLHQWKPDCLVSWIPWSNKGLEDDVDALDSMEAWSLGNRIVITQCWSRLPSQWVENTKTSEFKILRFWEKVWEFCFGTYHLPSNNSASILAASAMPVGQLGMIYVP